MEALGIRDKFSLPNFGGFGSDVIGAESLQARAKMIEIAKTRFDR